MAAAKDKYMLVFVGYKYPCPRKPHLNGRISVTVQRTDQLQFMFLSVGKEGKHAGFSLTVYPFGRGL